MVTESHRAKSITTTGPYASHLAAGFSVDVSLPKYTMLYDLGQVIPGRCCASSYAGNLTAASERGIICCVDLLVEVIRIAVAGASRSSGNLGADQHPLWQRLKNGRIDGMMKGIELEDGPGSRSRGPGSRRSPANRIT